jgi:hypothetical protein
MAEKKRTFESEIHAAKDLKIHPHARKDERSGADFGERPLSHLDDSRTTHPGSSLTREVVLRLIGWITKS